MSKQPDYFFLRHWITGEKYPNLASFRPVVLECVVSRSGMALSVYYREKLMFRVNGCGFDRLGAALGRFLEELFQPELAALIPGLLPGMVRPDLASPWAYSKVTGLSWHVTGHRVSLDGATSLSSMTEVAEAIGLSVQRHELKSSTILVISKKGV